MLFIKTQEGFLSTSCPKRAVEKARGGHGERLGANRDTFVEEKNVKMGSRRPRPPKKKRNNETPTGFPYAPFRSPTAASGESVKESRERAISSSPLKC